ncbi:hypothetical protein RchiOBHm_Chr7g0222231 [Rosa chinensis]|uniref:Uncharacterized protein n=1 Tax=Rosa chinensis TaxID=74649 RepID=A0A2P6PD79_ROSCH|nr:hypothetical protein RchiOBHm_Chr7g0222231 [Rosa chinensis]
MLLQVKNDATTNGFCFCYWPLLTLLIDYGSAAMGQNPTEAEL